MLVREMGKLWKLGSLTRRRRQRGFTFTFCKEFSLSARSYLMITILREERLGQLVGVDPGELVAAVEELVAKAAHLRTEVSH